MKSLHTSMANWQDRWPNIAADLAAVIAPDPPVVRLEDVWIGRKFAEGSRLRAIDVAAGAELDAVLESTRERASAAGWKQIHREEGDRQDVFRRTVRTLVKTRPQFLRVWPATVSYPAGALTAVRVDLEHSCTWAAMRRHVVGRSAHKLVRETWGLDAAVRSTRYELLADPENLASAAVIRETIELATVDMTATLATHGILAVESPVATTADGAPNRYVKTERYTKGVLTTAVVIGDDTTTVLLELDRTQRLR